MKIILKIALAELRSLFYSPVAWFLAVVFMIQCAFFYTEIIYSLANFQEYSLKVPAFKMFNFSITAMVFLNDNGIFSSVMQNLFLFIPLLTMGILSREINNGTIKLLYSSPIKTRDIVFGKFLSLMLFSLILLGIMGFFIVSAFFNIKAVDLGLLLSATLGFYLLVCAYASIGLFMSSLTTYQIVSAIGTFLTIFILGKIGSLWQDIDFVRDLTYFLSMQGRTEKMLVGLITTKDVLYFLLVISMFLGFSLLKLRAARESKSWYVTSGKYAALVLAILFIGYVSSRPSLVGYWDTTVEKTNTIHPKVQKIVKGLNNDLLEVTLYTNLLGKHVSLGLPMNRNNYLAIFWEKYVRFKPDIKFKYEYYYDAKPGNPVFQQFPGKNLSEIAKETAKAMDLDISMFKSPEDMHKNIDLGPEDYNLVMQLKYKGRTIFLRTFSDPAVWPDESQVAAALARLQNLELPKILFLTGNLERNIYVEGERGFSLNTVGRATRTSLINNGIDVDTLSLDTRNIPYKSENIKAVVLADPKTELSPLKKQRIQEYINSGGNMMILSEPGKENVLNSILKPLGVQYKKGVLVQVSKHGVPDLITPYLTKTAFNLAEEDILLKFKNGDINDDFLINQKGTMPIEYIENNETFTKKPLSKTKAGVWLKTRGQLVLDSVPPIFNPEKGDIKLESFITSVALTKNIKGKEQRILVSGDADYLSNKFNNSGYFGNAIYSWLNQNEYPIYCSIETPKDSLLLITSDTARKLKVLYIWILPSLFAVLGIIILIRRKRK